MTFNNTLFMQLINKEKAKGYTYKDIAEACDIRDKYFWYLYRGKVKNPSFLTVAKVMRYFGMDDVEELIN